MSEGAQIRFDYDKPQISEAERERIAEGMQRAEDNANPKWKRVVGDCVLAVARRQSELTVDDVLDEMDKLRSEFIVRSLAHKGVVVESPSIEALEKLCIDHAIVIPDHLPPSTHNFSALGPVMKRAATDGIIQHTDRVRRSRRNFKHGNRHNVWISLYFRAQ